MYLIPCQQLHNTIVNRDNFFNVFFGGFFVGCFFWVLCFGFVYLLVCLGFLLGGLFYFVLCLFACLGGGLLFGFFFSVLINRLKLEALKLAVSQRLSGL